jgi:hypothetical protein
MEKHPVSCDVTQVITEDIDRCAATLLHQLLQWQERARAARDARSGGRVAAKKRLVSGLRWVSSREHESVLQQSTTPENGITHWVHQLHAAAGLLPVCCPPAKSSPPLVAAAHHIYTSPRDT